MSRLGRLAIPAAVLAVAGALVLSGCSDSSSPVASPSSAQASALASESSDPSAAASAAPSGAAELDDVDVAIPENLSKDAFCLMTAPLYDEKARPTDTSDSETAVVLTAKRLIKGTQALSQAERLKALTGRQVAEIQVTIAILLTLWQQPQLSSGTIEEMSKASGVDVETLKIAQTKEFQDESTAALADLKKFCA